MKPLVSFLMPAYNVEPWIGEAIASVLAQTYSHLELIVVNDGSQDNTLAIAQQFASERVRVIDQDNRGQSAAENRAYREAQGDLIAYLDADDLIAPDKTARQVELLGNSETEYVAAGEWARFYRTPEEARFEPQALWADYLAPVDWLVLAWENHLMMHGAAWLIPRAIAERAGPWNEALSLINDFDYFSRIVLASAGVKFGWGARTYYRSGIAGSLSGSRSTAAWQSAFRSLELGTTNLMAREDSPRTRRASAIQFQYFIYDSFPEAPELRAQAEAKVESLGGCDLLPPGGPSFQMVAAIAGWRRAKYLQRWVYRYGYRRAALGWRLHRWWQQR